MGAKRSVRVNIVSIDFRMISSCKKIVPHKIRSLSVKDKAATSIGETLPDQSLIQDRAIDNSAVGSMQSARDLNSDLNFFPIFVAGPTFRPETGNWPSISSRDWARSPAKMPRLPDLSALLHTLPGPRDVIQVQGIQKMDDGTVNKRSYFFHISEGAAEHMPAAMLFNWTTGA